MLITRHQTLLRNGALALLFSLSALVLGCPKHEDFPAALDLVVPPTPDSFVITYDGPNVNGGFDYTLQWAISDPATVDRYRVYLIGASVEPEMVAETDNTQLPATFPFRITGLRLAVSAVSTGNVEGDSVEKIAP